MDKLAQKVLKVPLDILLDTLIIVVREELKHAVTEVFLNRSVVLLVVFYNKESETSQKAVADMENLILDYEYLRHSENDELNWREV